MTNGHANKRSAPGPGFWHTPGALLAMQRDRLEFTREMVHRFGEIVRLRVGPKQIILVSSPSGAKHVLKINAKNYRKGIGLRDAAPLLGQGLLTSDNETWHSQHARIHELFWSHHLLPFVEATAEETQALLQAWQPHQTVPLEILGEMTRLTLRVIGRTLLGTRLDDDARAIESSLRVITRRVMTHMMFPFAAYLPTPANLRFHRALRTINKLAYQILQRHDERNVGRNMLSLFFQNSAGVRTPAEYRQLRDEVITLIVAGHETTSALLAWTWVLLARHPEVQERMASEAAAVLVTSTPTCEQLSKLSYGKQVLEEVMRLYPPVWMLSREAIGPDEIDGYHVPAGAAVLICTYTLHRAASHWNDPDTFDPERFSPARSANRPAFTYLPFGAGSRHCIGRHYGMAEAQCIMGLMARAFRASPDLPYRDDDDAEALLTLRPRNDIHVTFQRRSAGI